MTAMSWLPSKIEHRDRLYYDRYEFVFTFYCRESYTLREKGLSAMVARLRFRQAWAGWTEDEAATVTENITQMHSTLMSISADFKYTVSHNHVSVYANDPKVFKYIVKECPFILHPRQKQALVTKPKNTIVLKNPKYKHRTYLKAQWVEETTKQHLLTFFDTQKSGIEPSGAFKNFLKPAAKFVRPKQWLPEHYYVEYNEPLYLTMLGLILPASNRKTMSVIQA